MHVEGESENTSLTLTPTWSVATVLTVLVLVSLLVERSIHWLSHWLKKTNRSPIFDALEKIKEELMLLGFLSLLLSTTSRNISKICIESKYYSSTFSPCILSNSEKGKVPHRDGRLLMGSFLYPSRRILSNLNDSSCEKGYVPFVSHEGLEQLHRFIFLMGITHVLYSCLTMLLAIVKVYTWGRWEGHARMKRHDSLSEVTREKTMKRQSTFVKYHTSGPWSRNRLMVWMKCFFRQFGHSVVRADYLTLRKGFIMNHNLPENYDFHSYMIRSMEEEFKMIVGVSAPLWGFVIAFMLFNVHGSNLYFWIAFLPIFLILLMGTELQHIIATLALEFASVTEFCSSGRLHPRDELFWFKKPELLLYLIHFVLFQNAFELASFFWFWWQFSYDSCFIRNHTLVYIRLFLGFSGQFLCSYSTLPLYALVTQMGTNYKAVLIPRRIRESIRGWGKTARRRRKKKERYGSSVDDPTIHTETSAILSLEDERETSEDLDNSLFIQIELQRNGSPRFDPSPISTENSSISPTNPLLQNSLSFPAQSHDNPQENKFPRSFSMPVKR